MNTFERQLNTSEQTKDQFMVSNLTNSFLGEQKDLFSNEKILEINKNSSEYREILSTSLVEKTDDKLTVEYDRRNKCFIVNNEHYTLGQIVAARRLGIDFHLPENLNESGDGKKLRKVLLEKITADRLYGELNKELAMQMSILTKKDDMLLSNAYNEIAMRSGGNNEQFGIRAEKIVLGFLEKISIDRPDLGIEVRESNAVEDVKNKIDFLVSSKHKIKGVGVNRNDFLFEEKTIGVQFTTNLSKKDHRVDQIANSKENGVWVDDIIYVEINPNILSNAINKWVSKGKKVSGPFEELPEDIKNQIILNLLQGMLTDEQEKSFKRKTK